MPITLKNIVAASVPTPAPTKNTLFVDANVVYTKDDTGTVTPVGGGGGGTVTSVDVAGAQGVTSLGGPVTTSGSITVGLGNIAPTGTITLAPTKNLLGQFSGAIGTRSFIQTTDVDTTTAVSVIPNGIATNAFLQAESTSTPTNNTVAQFGYSSTGFDGNPAVILLSTIRGAGTYVPLSLQAAPGGLSGLLIDILGNVVMGGTAALATTATDRFVHINSMAGTPTGVPTVPTGFTAAGKAPITVDTTNNILYFYSSGAWHASSGSGSSTTYEEFSATAAQTVFNTTISTVSNVSGGAGHLQVFVNGVYQMEGALKAYTVTGANQITFNTGLTLADDVVMYAF